MDEEIKTNGSVSLNTIDRNNKAEEFLKYCKASLKIESLLRESPPLLPAVKGGDFALTTAIGTRFTEMLRRYKMNTYNVIVTERLVRVLKIKADSIEEAVGKAEDMINSSEIILDADDFLDRDFEAFLEANSFEDALRNAISIGGDSDTLAAITCSIAGAYWGVPESIAEEAVKYLDDRLRQILLEFDGKYCL